MNIISLYEKIGAGTGNSAGYWTAEVVYEDEIHMSYSDKSVLAMNYPNSPQPSMVSSGLKAHWLTQVSNWDGTDSWFGAVFGDGLNHWSNSPTTADKNEMYYPYQPGILIRDGKFSHDEDFPAVIGSPYVKQTEPIFGLTGIAKLQGFSAGSEGSQPGDFASHNPLSPNWGHWRSAGGDP